MCHLESVDLYTLSNEQLAQLHARGSLFIRITKPDTDLSKYCSNAVHSPDNVIMMMCRQNSPRKGKEKVGTRRPLRR